MSSIDPTVKTSRVFEATIAVFDRLAEVTLPSNAAHNKSPGLYLFRDPGWEEREYVVVQTNDDSALADWIQSSPASAEERFVVDVLIRSMYPQTDVNDQNAAVKTVIERLEAIADKVQSIAWEPSTLKPKPIGFQNEIVTGRAVDVSFACAHTEQGIVGRAIVRFGLSAQI